MVYDRPSGESPHDDAGVDGILAMEEDEFRVAFGESVAHTLDINTWYVGEDLASMYQSLEEEVMAAVEQEGHIRERIRRELFPLVFQHPDAPPQADCYQVDTAMLERVHRGLLFNGSVEACDRTGLMHNSLPITIAQVGVSLVSYQGNSGTWVHRLYRRDLRVSGGADPLEEVFALLEQRRRRDSTDADTRTTRDRLSDFTQRGIMAYAERPFSCTNRRPSGVWVMDIQYPIESLPAVGWSSMEICRYCKRVCRCGELFAGHKRWVFVTSVRHIVSF